MTPLSRLRAFILLVAMIWQTVGMLGSYSVSQRAFEFEHLNAHVQDADHHHHADHSLHMDVDEASTQHFHGDGGSSGNGLTTASRSHLFDSKTAQIPDIPLSLWQSPTLKGPLRPPQNIA